VTIEYRDLTAKTDATVGTAGITTVGNLPLKVRGRPWGPPPPGRQPVPNPARQQRRPAAAAAAAACSSSGGSGGSSSERAPAAAPPPQLLRAALGYSKDQVELALLNGLTGCIKPGRLTLLLAPPSSGKSTFLKVLGEP
jgi:hypothetical protein